MLNLKKVRPTEREMTTPLFLLCCVQLGLSMADLDMLSIGLINDMYTESRKWFEEKYGFKVYKPKRYLVVGRRNDFECDEWVEIKADYTDVEIVTYDDLIDTVVSQFYQ